MLPTPQAKTMASAYTKAGDAPKAASLMADVATIRAAVRTTRALALSRTHANNAIADRFMPS